MNDTTRDGKDINGKVENEKINIDDYYISCEAMNKRYTNIMFNLDVIITSKVLALQPVKIEVWIYDQEDKRLLTDTRSVLRGIETCKITLRSEVTSIETWSIENPYQYTFRIVLKDERDILICEKSFQHGFRFIEIRNRKVYINGVEVMLNGVVYNYYEDKTIEELAYTYYEDIKMLKRNNINAVITYDYNSAPIFYDMCNKHGIYVIKKPLAREVLTKNSQLTEWNEEKTIETIEKYKNNPCIIMWMIDSRLDCTMVDIKNIKSLDNSRPIYYEGNNKVIKEQNRIKIAYDFVDKRGNELAYDIEEDGLAGMFLSDFIIDSEEDNKKNGVTNDRGMVFLNRISSPFAYEIKKEYELIEISPKDIIKGIFTIKNKGDYSNLNKYKFNWEILEDGIVIKSGHISDVCIVPHDQQDISIDYNLDKILENAWYHININMLTKEDTWWANQDYTVAWAQFRIPYKVRKKRKMECFTKIRIRDRKLKVEVFGEDFEIVIDKLKGNIKSMEFDKKEYLGSPIKIYVENQIGKYELSKVKEVMINEKSGVTQVHVIRKCSHIKGNIKTVYSIESDGKVTIENIINSSNKYIKVGMTTQISSSFNDFSWFGKGPYDTYDRRNGGTKVGLYYYNLHENSINNRGGNKSNTIWGALTDCDGEGILIESSRDILLNINPRLIVKDTDRMEDQEDNEENERIIIDTRCACKAEHKIFDTSGKSEDIYAFSIKRVI